jgi:hypothetical protein
LARSSSSGKFGSSSSCYDELEMLIHHPAKKTCTLNTTPTSMALLA